MSKKKISLIIISTIVVGFFIGLIFLTVWLCKPQQDNNETNKIIDAKQIGIEVKNPITGEWITDIPYSRLNFKWKNDGAKLPLEVRFKYKNEYIELEKSKEIGLQPVYDAPDFYPTEVGMHKVWVSIKYKKDENSIGIYDNSIEINVTIYGQLKPNTKVVLEEELSNFELDSINFDTGTFSSWIKPYKFMVDELGKYRIKVTEQYMHDRSITLDVLGVEPSSYNDNEIVVDLVAGKEYTIYTQVEDPRCIYYKDDYYILDIQKF